MEKPKLDNFDIGNKKSASGQTRKIVDFRRGKLVLYVFLTMLVLAIIFTVWSSVKLVQEISQTKLPFSENSIKLDSPLENDGFLNKAWNWTKGLFNKDDSPASSQTIEINESQLNSLLPVNALAENDLENVNAQIEDDGIHLQGTYNKIGKTDMKAVVKPEIKDGKITAKVKELKVGVISIPGFLRDFLAKTVEESLLGSLANAGAANFSDLRLAPDKIVLYQK